MQKVARKPSTDPAQEKLRQNKALWNKDVSLFINDLINFKKTMNGAPSKFFMEKSSIKEPIPADPATIIGSLAGDFQELAQKGNGIITQQLEYSKTRRKKQVQAPAQNSAVPVATTPPANDLSKQLAAFEQYNLIINASNPVSRFFSRILNPAIGGSPAARIRKYRMSMLTAAASVFKDLENLQVAIVGKSSESIFTASKTLGKIEDNWNFLSKGFYTYKSTMPEEVKDTGGEITPPLELTEDKPKVTTTVPPAVEPNVSQISSAISDYKTYAANFLNLASVKHMNSLIMKYVDSDAESKKNLIPQILNAYQTVLFEANSKNNTSGKSLKEIFETVNLNKTASLEVVAQSFLRKWLGKARHKLSPLDKTSAIRLDIYNLSDECRKTIDLIMDSLEKEMNVDYLEGLINKVNNDLTTIRDLMRALDATIKGKGFDAPFMNLLDKGKITEFGPNLSDKQKQHLQRVLEQKQMRELTNLYYRK